jgi:hypothetical protein
MQERETALRPQLMQLSAETEKLMIKVEKDTVNVESQKEVRFYFSVQLFLFFYIYTL